MAISSLSSQGQLEQDLRVVADRVRPGPLALAAHDHGQLVHGGRRLLHGGRPRPRAGLRAEVRPGGVGRVPPQALQGAVPAAWEAADDGRPLDAQQGRGGGGGAGLGGEVELANDGAGDGKKGGTCSQIPRTESTSESLESAAKSRIWGYS